MSQAGVASTKNITPPPGSVTDLEGQDSVIVPPNASGVINVQAVVVPAGSTPFTTTGNAGTNTETWNIQRTQAIASSNASNVGLASFNSANFTVDANGFVSSLGMGINYTNVTHAMSPYIVQTTDYYISVDCSAGTVQLQFPNVPTFKQIWIVKDRTGNAAVSNITITTPGGTVTFDGQTTFTMFSNFQSMQLLANATQTYEVF